VSVEFRNLIEFKDFISQEKVLDRFNIDRIGIFGSFARAEPANDIDILVSQIPLRMASALKQFLESRSKSKFDIVVEEYANPILLYRAKQDMVYVQRY